MTSDGEERMKKITLPAEQRIEIKKTPERCLFDVRTHDEVAGLLSERFHDRDEDDSAQERDEEAVKVESCRSALAKEAHDPPAQYRTDDAYYDVKERALLGVGLHDDGCYPTNESTEYYP